MLKSKRKGLFVDISEFSVLAVRTSGYEVPMVVEDFADLPVEKDHSLDKIRAFLGKYVDLKGGNYESICGVHPKSRFI